MAETKSQAVEKYTPFSFMKKYADSFTAALPSHIEPKQWLAVAMDAVRRDPKIEKAANNDLGRFAAAVRQAARMGLEPGTEQFYLVPFSPRKGEPQVIEGIVGYQGLVEMMYRAGAVQSVKAELVKENDTFSYSPSDEIPHHQVDWFKPRGQTIGAYAYAVMEAGAVSKVIMMGMDEIDRHRAYSPSARSDYSPWNTNPDAMALKTVVRQLAKWVPTSAEYRREKLRSAQTVWDERIAAQAKTEFEVTITPEPEAGPGEHIDPLTGELQADVIDGEIVEDAPADAPAAESTESAPESAESTAVPEPAPAQATEPAPATGEKWKPKTGRPADAGMNISQTQVETLQDLAQTLGLDWPGGVVAEAQGILGGKLASIRALNRAGADRVIAALQQRVDAAAEDGQLFPDAEDEK